MTPKEKAKELTEKMFNVDLDCDNEAMCMLYPHAIKCALIAVEEILDDDVFDMSEELFENRINYWEQVKYEIEQL